MAGLFGLGGKTKYVDEPDPVNQGDQEKEAFYLEPDEAKTLGNIEFMRKPKTIKRSFPTGDKIVRGVSSIEKTKPNPSNVGSRSDTSSDLENSSNSSPRNSQDSGLDMFRKMAREIKK